MRRNRVFPLITQEGRLIRDRTVKSRRDTKLMIFKFLCRFNWFHKLNDWFEGYERDNLHKVKEFNDLSEQLELGRYIRKHHACPCGGELAPETENGVWVRAFCLKCRRTIYLGDPPITAAFFEE